jgi:hypothetical protein
VNKKKQKNFVNLGRAGFAVTGPEAKKSSCRFVQKAAAFFNFCPKPRVWFVAVKAHGHRPI